jgi:bacillithiol synthase
VTADARPDPPHAAASMALIAGDLPASGRDLEVQVEPLQGGPLVADYLAGRPAVGPFYTGHPGDIAAYRRKAAEVEARLPASRRQAVAGAIEPLGDAGPHLARILGGDGFFVTTGQQPALFGGPLYTIYKALTAIRMASMLEARLGSPVLALFWIGADDHDWEEANHITVLDEAGALQRIAVRARADAVPVPLSERRWGRGVGTAVDEMVAALPVTPRAREIAAHLRHAYTPDATVADSFTSTMKLLLGDRRIALVSSAHPALRRAAAPVLYYEAAHSAEHHEKILRQTEWLVACGYPAQVPLATGASNLMQVDGRGRDRLMQSRHGWATRRERQAMPEDMLLRLIHDEPHRFSPNVLLRPIVESAVFPTVAYVAGPGELRYFGQIGCLFEAHGILPPVVVPRSSMTLVEPGIRRLLTRLGLEHTALRSPFDDVVTEVVRRDMPPAAIGALERLRQSLHTGYEQLVAATDAIDPTLAGPLGVARDRSLLQANDAERRILRQLKRRDAVLVEQLGRAAASLHPGGVPQERVLNPLQYLARYGPTFMDLLERQAEPVFHAAAGWTGPQCK